MNNYTTCQSGLVAGSGDFPGPGPADRRRGWVMPEPTRPGEIPDSVPLGDLLAAAQRHGGALFEHRYGIAPLADAERAGHALSELAYQHALSERVLYGRWVCAVEALDTGVSHDQVAAAMGLDVDELHTGLRNWARGQLRHGLIDDARHAEVLALLGEPPAGHS